MLNIIHSHCTPRRSKPSAGIRKIPISINVFPKHFPETVSRKQPLSPPRSIQALPPSAQSATTEITLPMFCDASSWVTRAHQPPPSPVVFCGRPYPPSKQQTAYFAEIRINKGDNYLLHTSERFQQSRPAYDIHSCVPFMAASA